ncbi:MAG: HEAT repeat domain-containing protein [Sedimentisphaerales bacterium]|nr:HEAT repeat domain-containing protein [Sedimentisphaerales bacterium]
MKKRLLLILFLTALIVLPISSLDAKSQKKSANNSNSGSKSNVVSNKKSGNNSSSRNSSKGSDRKSSSKSFSSSGKNKESALAIARNDSGKAGSQSSKSSYKVTTKKNGTVKVKQNYKNTKTYKTDTEKYSVAPTPERLISQRRTGSPSPARNNTDVAVENRSSRTSPKRPPILSRSSSFEKLSVRSNQTPSSGSRPALKVQKNKTIPFPSTNINKVSKKEKSVVKNNGSSLYQSKTQIKSSELEKSSSRIKPFIIHNHSRGKNPLIEQHRKKTSLRKTLPNIGPGKNPVVVMHRQSRVTHPKRPELRLSDRRTGRTQLDKKAVKFNKHIRISDFSKSRPSYGSHQHPGSRSTHVVIQPRYGYHDRYQFWKPWKISRKPRWSRHYNYHHRSYACIFLHGWGLFNWPWDRTYTTYYEYIYPERTVYVYDSNPVVVVNPEEPVVEIKPVYGSRQEELIDYVTREEPAKRLAAVQELARFDSIQVVAALIEALINDADPQVRVAAAQSLSRIGNPRAYEALLRSAEVDEEVSSEAQLAADTLYESVDREGIYVSNVFPPMNQGDPVLGEYLEDLRFGSEYVRKQAAEKLVDQKGTQAVVALINTMMNDPHQDVREEAAESLGKIGDRMALPFLKWTRDNDNDNSTRKEAEKAIEKIYNTISIS